jgi:hypothetical protein
LLFILILVLGVPLAAFLLLEGGSSLAVLALDLTRVDGGKLHGSTFMRYDSLVGWVSEPNVKLPNYYGPGAHLHTNSSGFRGTRDVANPVPQGRVRVICSGNSFAFGLGVGDDESWCHRLEAREPRLETVNLGQAGYGSDQAYLRYKRDGVPLDPALHVFTFIWDDIYRMQLDNQWGYPKPRLALVKGNLQIENVPVPRGAYARPKLYGFMRSIRGAVRELRAIELIRRIRVWMAPAGAEWTERGLVSSVADSATWQVASAMLEDLSNDAAKRGAVLLVVHLPSGDDARFQSTPWRQLARETARQKGLHYLDLTDSLEKLPPERVSTLYIPNDPHFSVAGNDWVAEEILAFIRRTPPLVEHLNRVGGVASTATEAGSARTP